MLQVKAMVVILFAMLNQCLAEMNYMVGMVVSCYCYSLYEHFEQTEQMGLSGDTAFGFDVDYFLVAEAGAVFQIKL